MRSSTHASYQSSLASLEIAKPQSSCSEHAHHAREANRLSSKQFSERPRPPAPARSNKGTCMGKLEGQKPTVCEKRGAQALQSSPFGSDSTECELEKGI